MAAPGVPNVYVSYTSLLKFAQHCPSVAKLTRSAATEVLRKAIESGAHLPPDTVIDSVEALCFPLPPEYQAPSGDVLVALVERDRYCPEDLAITTVRRLRSVIKPVLPLRKPEPGFGGLPVEAVSPPAPTPAPEPPKGEPAKRKRKLAPEPQPSPPPPALEYPDNRGAALCRQEIARRRMKQWQLGQLAGLPAHRISRLLRGEQCPSVAEAIAIHKAVGVPVEAWGAPA